MECEEDQKFSLIIEKSVSASGSSNYIWNVKNLENIRLLSPLDKSIKGDKLIDIISLN